MNEARPLTINDRRGSEVASGSEGGLLRKALDVDSPVSTEFHRLYSRLVRLESQQKLSVLLVTSARREEGKTTTSALLGYTAAAHSDKRVVVVDCDLRRPRLHELFGLSQRVGVADALASLLPVSSVMKNTSLSNLKVITSGRGIGLPTGLFESSVFKETVAELRANFDLVIIDSAPVLPVSDAFLISGHCDGVLLVVMAGKTPIEVVARAGDLLNEGGGKILGAVINNAEEVLPYYYDYEYYGYEDEKGSDRG
ncbi:MAG: CpsD/CapB family tyrosine-protein kinase [Candidatus Eiseniibacteriota bacterium]|nr:MAG: CpsD/CapB family tyrosine-protein kinase [Candidatus Eisenbacteria bacterium]